MSENRDVVVVERYRAAYPEPLALARGQRVRWERRGSDWPGWLWCTDEHGRGGWVPESWLELDGDRATVVRDYDASELSVSRDERLMLLSEESGWAWCRNLRGEHGWVPLRNLKPLE